MNTYESNAIVTDVTAIKFFKSFILAGIGGTLNVYNEQTLEVVVKVSVFDGEPIYGIASGHNNSDDLLVYGGKKLKVFGYHGGAFQERKCTILNDWILNAKWMKNNRKIAVVSMHNKASLWTKELKFVRDVTCKERCISYCAYIANNQWEDVVILSGTVFSEVLVWRVDHVQNGYCPVLSRLLGHKGVIFSIDCNLQRGLICSTSDDRSAILWKITSDSLFSTAKAQTLCLFQMCQLFGHSSRVFRCKVLNNHILTAGEDSIINVWSLEGELIRKIEANQGDSVWALEGSENSNRVIAGGGDGGITLFPLNTTVSTSKITTVGEKVPKHLAILSSDNVVAVMDNGELHYYHAEKQQWTESIEHPDLKSYCLLEVSSCGNLIALAGYHGSVHIYREQDSSLQKLSPFAVSTRGRIYSFHWLHCTIVLICEPNGILSLWNTTEDGQEFLQVCAFQLPPAKERWTTAACMLSPLYYAIGDRKGHIFLYMFGRESPLQIVKNAHNYLGITQLYFYKDELVSLGRNSTMKKYRFSQKTKHLKMTSSDKVPFSWIAACHRGPEYMLLVGFSGTNLILWDYLSRRTLLEYNCGGGHRSWSFKKTRQAELKFIYIKDRVLNVIACTDSDLTPTDLVSGHHVREVNALKMLRSNVDGTYLVVSGGEDTTLRVSSIDNEGNVNNIMALKHHLSSIRAITLTKATSKCEDIKRYLLFSGGGRAQIIAWELALDALNNVTCVLRDSYYEPVDREEAEVRIMDLCTVTLGVCDVLMVCVCSDGKIKFFSAASNDQVKLVHRGDIFYKLNSIVKVLNLEIHDHHLLITTATDGNIVFWDITDLICTLEDDHRAARFEEIVCNKLPLAVVAGHQSAINSIFYKILPENKLLLLTGGDDNAVKLTLLEISENVEEINVLSSFTDSNQHCAHVTGAFLANNYFLTASVDQSIVASKWDIDKDGTVTFEMLSRCDTAVGDVQGMDCFQMDDGGFKILVYGNGLEMLTLYK